jgi:hypothetical protein
MAILTPKTPSCPEGSNKRAGKQHRAIALLVPFLQKRFEGKGISEWRMKSHVPIRERRMPVAVFTSPGLESPGEIVRGMLA